MSMCHREREIGRLIDRQILCQFTLWARWAWAQGLALRGASRLEDPPIKSGRRKKEEKKEAKRRGKKGKKGKK